MSEFLSKEEATAYFENKSEYRDIVRSFRDLNIVKIYPRRRFILFMRTGPDDYKLGGILRVTSIEMDENGIYVDLILNDKVEYQVDYLPTPIECLDQMVFLSVPSRVQVERTLKNTLTGVEEGLATALLVKHKHSPAWDEIGSLQMLGEVEFIRKFGEGVGREMIKEFLET